MRDEFDARLWNDHHDALSEQIDNMLKVTLRAFCTLTRLQFDAPWKKARKAR